MSETIIKLENAYKSHKMGDVTVHALRDVSLNIDTREITAVLGPSGSGKTTLLDMTNC